MPLNVRRARPDTIILAPSSSDLALYVLLARRCSWDIHENICDRATVSSGADSPSSPLFSYRSLITSHETKRGGLQIPIASFPKRIWSDRYQRIISELMIQ